MANSDYVIRLAKESEKEEVIQLINDYHKLQDPISLAYRLKHKDVITPEEGKLLNGIARELVLVNNNVVAIHVKTGKVVAAVILTTYELSSSKSTKDYPLVILPHYTDLYKDFSKTANTMYANLKFFKNFPQYKRFIKLRSMCVHEDHRNKGLAKALLRKCIEWAKENDWNVLHSFFTLPASRGSAESVGFKFVAEMDMSTVKNSRGEYFFADVSPNNVTNLMAYDVESD